MYSHIREFVTGLLVALMIFLEMPVSAAGLFPTAMPTAGGPEVATVRVGTPDVQESFSTDTGRWPVKGIVGERSIADGMMTIRVEDSQTWEWSAFDDTFDDFYLEVDTVHLDGPLDNEFGVIFRMQDDENFYLFALSSDGYYRLGKSIADEWLPIVKWTKSSLIKTGEGSKNRIGLLAVGDWLVLLINDKEVKRLQDDSFASGTVNLLVGSADEVEPEIGFDNFRLWLAASEAGSQSGGAAAAGPAVSTVRSGAPQISETFPRDTGTWTWGTTSSAVRSFEDGMLMIKMVKGNKVSWSVYDGQRDEFDDFYLEVDAVHQAGPLENSHGVVFRMQDGDNFYLFEVDCLGQYELLKLVADEWETLIDWTESSVLDTGEGCKNTLGVLAVGDWIVLQANNKELKRIRDDEFSSGMIALAASAYDEAGSEVGFDNFRLWPAASVKTPAAPVKTPAAPVKTPTATPAARQGSISGTVKLMGEAPEEYQLFLDRLAQYYGAPSVVSKHIALCKIDMDLFNDDQEAFEQNLPCWLLKTTATTDRTGHFRFDNLEPGLYLVLYESGITDFYAGMKLWGGKQFKLKNNAWLTEYYRGNASGKNITQNVADTDSDIIGEYAVNVLLAFNSPFVLAHTSETFSTGSIHRVWVEVTAGETAELVVPIVK